MGIVVGVIVAAGILGCLFAAVHHALQEFSRSKLDEKLSMASREQWNQLLTRQRNHLLLLTAMLRTGMNLTVLMAMVVLFRDRFERPWVDLLAAFVVGGAVVSVFAIAIPLSWATYAPESLLAAALPVLRLLLIVFRPALWFLHLLDPVVGRLVGLEAADELNAVEKELLDVVSEGEKTGLVDEDQKEMIEAIVEFPTTMVGEIMTPRTDVKGITPDISLAEVKRFVEEAGHSRVPVYEGDLDHILGIMYAKDLLRLVGSNGEVPFDLRPILRDAQFVPETKTIRDLLKDFQVTKVHIAIVLDEYGGTAGLVTIEDILEELVGEIYDEYEPHATQQEPQVRRTDERTVEADGRAHIDDLNDELESDLPEDEDYDTVGGFVFATLGHIPEIGEAFEYENVRVTVLDAERTRVNRVRVELMSEREQTEVSDTSWNGGK